MKYIKMSISDITRKCSSASLSRAIALLSLLTIHRFNLVSVVMLVGSVLHVNSLRLSSRLLVSLDFLHSSRVNLHYANGDCVKVRCLWFKDHGSVCTYPFCY
jgi:hypothetical protein